VGLLSALLQELPILPVTSAVLSVLLLAPLLLLLLVGVCLVLWAAGG
jgi:hypothetical protein